jgi:ABC-type glycerol-3-phosphate transport system substrate-binding protein
MSRRGGHIMRRQAILLAAAVAFAPLGVQAADLVVWWEKGYDDQENEAVREIIAAFEQDTGKQVELELPHTMIARSRCRPRSKPGSRPISS